MIDFQNSAEPNEMHGAVLLEMVKSLSLARLVKSKSSIATSSDSEVRDVKTFLVIGGFSE